MIVRFLIKGRVQNVGYRHFAITKANTILLNGMIRNLNDGNVELFLNGTEEKINIMYNFCLKGSVFSRVEEIEKEIINKLPNNEYYITF